MSMDWKRCLQYSIKETEVNEKLQDTMQKLLQTGVDKRETDREAKLKETLASLKRIFPGENGISFGVDLVRGAWPRRDPLQADCPQI